MSSTATEYTLFIQNVRAVYLLHGTCSPGMRTLVLVLCHHEASHRGGKMTSAQCLTCHIVSSCRCCAWATLCQVWPQNHLSPTLHASYPH